MTATARPTAPTRRDWVEIVATVLLAFAAVATAWSSYQANRWNGEPTKATGRVNALRIDAARAQGLAEGQTQVDIAMFFQWVNATATDDDELADFYLDRFRPEFRPGVRRLAGDRSADGPGGTADAVRDGRVPAAGARTTPNGSTPKPRRWRRSSAATSSAPPTTSSASCCSPSPCSSPA